YDSLLFFFLHVPAPPVISPLSLHDALPICFSSFFSDRQLSTDLHIQMHRKPILITLICCALAVLANGCGKPDADASASASSLTIDRKSTRLNSSHVKISYAVFCLKKKTHTR